MKGKINQKQKQGLTLRYRASFSRWERKRAVSNPRISALVGILHETRRIFPPLKKLLFEAFWFVFAAVEIVRFLRSLL